MGSGAGGREVERGLRPTLFVAGLGGVRDRDHSRRHGERHVERDLEAGLVEAGKGAPRVGGLELREAVPAAFLRDAVDAGELVVERGGVGEEERRATGRERDVEGDDELLGIGRLRAGREAHAGVRAMRLLRDSRNDGVRVDDGQGVRVEHDVRRLRGDLEIDADRSGEGRGARVEIERERVGEGGGERGEVTVRLGRRQRRLRLEDRRGRPDERRPAGPGHATTSAASTSAASVRTYRRGSGRTIGGQARSVTPAIRSMAQRSLGADAAG